MTAHTAWTEADYYAGFRQSTPARPPLLKVSLATAVAAINLCAVFVLVRIQNLPELDFAAARGDNALVQLTPARPTLLAVAGAPATSDATSGFMQMAAASTAAPAVRMAAVETGTQAYELAMATQNDAMMPQTDPSADLAAYNMPLETVTADDSAPAPVVDQQDSGLPDSPVPYLLMADAEPVD